jgi:hypothetical protein
MLRRPSEFRHTLREEGCSSTTFGEVFSPKGANWNNPAGRGSAPFEEDTSPAVLEQPSSQ